MKLELPETLYFKNGVLSVLDQRRLPQEVRYWELSQLEDAWEAIKTLAVRGAPAIGITAAYALAQSMSDSPSDERFEPQLEKNAAYLKSARPTAVNLAWAVDRVVGAWRNRPEPDTLLAEAQAIHEEDLALSLGIAEHGAPLIEPHMGVLTHCNAGSLATARFGTATAPMYKQHFDGVPFTVFADETRPLWQGARLTAWELAQAGIDVRLICDNMAASMFADGRINLAIVGTDRVTANGDVVNKIGTLGVAVLCRHFDVPFYVACPSSTFDPTTATGADVEIEQRDPSEVTGTHGAEVRVENPAFDVTPADLVTGIITERGIVKPSEIGRFLSDAR